MKKLAIAALITLGLGGVAYTAMAERGPMLEKLDLDQDGSITKGEVSAHRADRFMSADTNGDNLVSPEEFEAFAEAERERRESERRANQFAKLDANGDGLVSAQEHADMANERLDRMFERLDTDGDGAISEAEREAAKERMRDRPGNRGFGRRG